MSLHCSKWSLALAVLLSAVTTTKAREYEVLRIETEFQPDKLCDLSKIRVKKLRPGVYGFDGQAEVFQTVGNDTKVAIKLYYSANGADKYQLLPHHLNPGSLCDFMNNDYKKYVPDLYKVSDFPHVEDEYYCPLPKRVYKVRKYEFDFQSLPKIFKPGYYKAQGIIELDNGDKSIINVFVKVNGP